MRLVALKKFDSKPHWELARNVDRSIVYCMKEDTRVEGPYEYGIRPIKRDSKVDWEEVKNAAVKGELSKVPA
jgi:hypothetical protein